MTATCWIRKNANRRLHNKGGAMDDCAGPSGQILALSASVEDGRDRLQSLHRRQRALFVVLVRIIPAHASAASVSPQDHTFRVPKRASHTSNHRC